MAYHRSPIQRPGRRGVAAIEFALVFPMLVFILVAGADFGRVFYFDLIVGGCATNGALFGSQNTTNAANTAGIQAAALTNATNLSPAPTVSSSAGTDASGNPYVSVTVTYTFTCISSYTGIINPIVLSRTVQMRVVPSAPSYS